MLKIRVFLLWLDKNIQKACQITDAHGKLTLAISAYKIVQGEMLHFHDVLGTPH